MLGRAGERAWEDVRASGGPLAFRLHYRLAGLTGGSARRFRGLQMVLLLCQGSNDPAETRASVHATTLSRTRTARDRRVAWEA